MKESTIEQKAERYDKVVSKLKSFMAQGVDPLITRADVQDFFPELKESEDERIKGAIIDHLKDNNLIEWATWLEKQGKLVAYYEDKLDRCACENFNKGYKKALEKQGEQKPTEWHREDEQNLNACLGYIPDEFLRRWLKDVIHTKYVKPTDKVEPKFKVGDTIKCKHDDRQFTIKSVDLDKGTYTYTQEGCGNDIDYADEEFELVEQKTAWKPSKEQVEALNTMAMYCDIATSFDAYKQKVVESLCQDLKNLRGE